MMQRWNPLDALLSRCRKDVEFRKNFCTSPILMVAQFVYNHSTLFALFSGVAAAILFDGAAWIISIFVAMIIFMVLPLAITGLIKGDTI